MKKLLLLPAILLSLFFISCNQEKEIDINQLSSELLQNVTFEDELTQIDAATTAKLYHIENAVNQFVYISSGATAEEIAVFEFSSKDDAAKAVQAAQERLAGQKESYESYMPKEVQKLDNAVLKQTGRYLILCVADGTEAENIINKYF